MIGGRLIVKVKVRIWERGKEIKIKIKIAGFCSRRFLGLSVIIVVL